MLLHVIGAASIIMADALSYVSEPQKNFSQTGRAVALMARGFNLRDAVVEASGEVEEELDLVGGPVEPLTGAMIANSDRVGTMACTCLGGECLGQVCEYTCDEGFTAIGQHTFRNELEEGILLDKGFFGGRCVKLCKSDECPKNSVALRVRDESSCGGPEPPCYQTHCYFPGTVPSITAEDAALMDLAKGNWALWQMARSEISGLYVDNINLNKMFPSWGVGKADVTGVGLIMECIAHRFGWQTTKTAQQKIRFTLRGLQNKTEEVKMSRSYFGKFFPGIMNTKTGLNPKGEGRGNVAATGLLVAGALFAKTYFQINAPDADLTPNIAKLAEQIFTDIEWDQMLCNDKNKVDVQGDKVAWDLTPTGQCGTPAKIRGGRLQFNEQFVARWLGFKWACNFAKRGSCGAMKKMYDASVNEKTSGVKWQNEASQSGEKRILSKWGSYVVQLPYYMAHSFNADEDFVNMFRQSWAVEKDYYSFSPYFSPSRYGLGAGPTSQWCEGTGYIADRLKTGDRAGCLTYSPHGTVGYLATGIYDVKKDVLKMLADGEAVTMIKDPTTKQSHPILDRRMLLDPEWRPWGVTMIDMAGELFGLASHFFGTKFFEENSNHFRDELAHWTIPL